MRRITLLDFIEVSPHRTAQILAGLFKHNFAFAGLLTCAHHGCTVTTELQKGKYVYYRCSHGRGKCPLPYIREQDVSDRLGELLKQIYVPETIARSIVDSLHADLSRSKAKRQEQRAALNQRLATLRTRMDQLYPRQRGWQDH